MDIVKIFKKINGGIKRLIILFYPDAFVLPELKPKDPEQRFLYGYCKGLGIDVGCGSKKIHPNAIGIDITPRGIPGKYGSETKKISQADICLSGDDLYIFGDSVFDYVIARHNLEHYNNPVRVLREWKRVLKVGGVLGLIVPDEEKIDTISLDKTHKYAFTKQSLSGLIEEIGGFKILKLETCIPNWSFVYIGKKTEA